MKCLDGLYLINIIWPVTFKNERNIKDNRVKQSQVSGPLWITHKSLSASDALQHLLLFPFKRNWTLILCVIYKRCNLVVHIPALSCTAISKHWFLICSFILHRQITKILMSLVSVNSDASHYSDYSEMTSILRCLMFGNEPQHVWRGLLLSIGVVLMEGFSLPFVGVHSISWVHQKSNQMPKWSKTDLSIGRQVHQMLGKTTQTQCFVLYNLYLWFTLGCRPNYYEIRHKCHVWITKTGYYLNRD